MAWQPNNSASVSALDRGFLQLRDFFLENRILLAVLAVVAYAFYLACTAPYMLANADSLLDLVLLELLLLALYNFRKVFFVLLVVAFTWAGVSLPLHGNWLAGRWVALAVGAIAGMTLWLKERDHIFRPIHLIAFACFVSALVSATVSDFPRTAFLKSVSLMLLFVYASGGARLAVLRGTGRFRFMESLVVACEITASITVLFYWGVHFEVFGNPNSLGAVLAVVLVPMLCWGVLVAQSRFHQRRRAALLAMCLVLLVQSRSRASLLAGIVTCCVLLLALKRYRLFLRASLVAAAAVGLVGLWSPSLIWTSATDTQEMILYKGHREEGILGSRKGPWQDTLTTIQERPLFGQGFGTTKTGAETEWGLTPFSTVQGTAREHGSSYFAIFEWLGLVGVVPFLLLLGAVVLQIKKTISYMRRSLDPYHPAVPVAMLALAGILHVAFEDWLFAVGYYLSFLFWSLVFCLPDLTEDLP